MAKNKSTCYTCGQSYGQSYDENKMCNIKDPERMSQLSADPTVSCMTCLASAHDPSNLCMPFDDMPQKR